MPPGQHEMGFFVFGQGKGRGFISLYRVAPITGIEVGRGRKLSAMTVAVTIGAAIKLNFE